MNSTFLRHTMILLSIAGIVHASSIPLECKVALQKLPTTLVAFDAQLKKTDQDKGAGLRYAKIFTPNSSEPISKAGIELTPEIIKKSKQTVYFYSERKGRGATGVRGIPTHVYINEKSGKIAYMGFQGQPVSLVEMTSNTTQEIPNQGIDRHPGGFSTAIGNLKGSKIPLSDYTIEQLRSVVGQEGEHKKIEFESGVIVEGVIESYTKNNYEARDIATVITFKEGTTTVTYGVHTLFQKDWGIYDLLIAPDMILSGHTE